MNIEEGRSPQQTQVDVSASVLKISQEAETHKSSF